MIATLPIACRSVHETTHDSDKRLWLIATGSAGGAAAPATPIPHKSAPTKFEIPPHRHRGDTRILIGEDTAA